ncbi:hypothetical protein ACQR1W_23740 [Bradyrhizobium sp. HKCCYLS1011]|uniref:hypothetical protein n=1 Tax=Bradyrhizobium sp. HKCCYLS1011 TaxID=3420733 RepID=UPI003EBC953A
MIGDGGEIDEAGALLIVRREAFSRGNRNGGLADAPGTYDRHETLLRQAFHQIPDNIGPTDDA